MGKDIAGFNYEFIKLHQENSLWTVTISKPQSLNALSVKIIDELGDFLRQLSEMGFEHARGLIITGEGEKAFVAGADIKELAELNEEQANLFAVKGQSVFHELNLLKIPVVAAVNGFALGGGCELALACDFIVASKNAKFGLPEVTLGLIPGFGGTVRLSRAVGLRKARELIFTGDMIDADEAYRIGLVNEVVPSVADLLPVVNKKFQTVFKRAPVAVAHSKLSVNRSWDLEVEEALKYEAEMFSQLFSTEDAKEGTNAFLNKRKPEFKGI
ncbi:MAG: enoyl-CoA hydratase/isomerase family protein [Bdellovibrionales bacterium]|nr:enoyl-CoA hydratase/isomerase family protein [Bdellovibrionales bacterium]